MLERLFYEVRPFSYLSGAFLSYRAFPSTTMAVFAIWLAVSTLMILWWRLEFRSR